MGCTCTTRKEEICVLDVTVCVAPQVKRKKEGCQNGAENVTIKVSEF
jgi:hypothetical protein